MNRVRKFENASDRWTLESCILHHELGSDCIWNDGKDLTLVEQKIEPSDGNLKSSGTKQNLSKSISKNSSADKTNYSTVCLRCGRRLKSEISQNRGYGSYCYSKMLSDTKNDDNKSEEINFIDELRGMN